MRVKDITEPDGLTYWQGFKPGTCWKLIHSPLSPDFVDEYYIRTPCCDTEIWPLINLKTGDNRMPREGDRFVRCAAEVRVREL